MGTNCCPPSRRSNESSKMTQITTNLTNEITGFAKPLTSINQVKTIPMHGSRKMLEIKCSANTATTQTSGNAQDASNTVANKIKPNLSYMKCPTNFKIEPGHFRIEKKKETLNDRYFIEGVIGEGKFGVVKRIKEKQSNSFRAIKIINKANCQETDNLVDEIKIIKSLVEY